MGAAVFTGDLGIRPMDTRPTAAEDGVMAAGRRQGAGFISEFLTRDIRITLTGAVTMCPPDPGPITTAINGVDTCVAHTGVLLPGHRHGIATAPPNIGVSIRAPATISPIQAAIACVAEVSCLRVPPEANWRDAGPISRRCHALTDCIKAQDCGI